MYKYIKRVQYCEIAYELHISSKTVGIHCELIREKIVDYVINHSVRIGGLDDNGSHKIVEIEQSYFFKSKYIRGRFTEGSWYIGGGERGSKRTFFVPVLNRNAQTITQAIINNVLPCTNIITDEWRAYRAALSEPTEYDHQTVNHSVNFVNPANFEIHTQHIEGFWSISWKFLRGKHGVNSEAHFQYLQQLGV
ncbi:hypothetical protein DMUE_1177 [Dictyocoela muelleri]|nr:hypothetical protein DMUE_1177 [Dictyocoela muelleri]